MKLFGCRSRSWSANVVGLLALILVAAPSIVMAQVNECQTNNGGCGGGSAFLATCTDTPGGFYCTCNLGFTGNGFSCSGDDLIMYLDATVSGSFIGSAWRDIPSNNSLAIPCQNVAYNDTVRSLYFNGASSMCQLNHTLGAASMWQPASVTMEAWVYAQACPPDQNILTRENSYEIGIHTPAGGSCNADAATNPWIWTYPPSPNLMNTWVHIVATHQNQTGGRKVIYVNGNETGSSAIGGPIGPYASGEACITVGSRYCGTQPGVGWFKGYISSVRLWGKALTASEVLRNYNMGIFGNGTKFNTSTTSTGTTSTGTTSTGTTSTGTTSTGTTSTGTTSTGTTSTGTTSTGTTSTGTTAAGTTGYTFIVADSQADYSSVQGNKNWWYLWANVNNGTRSNMTYWPGPIFQCTSDKSNVWTMSTVGSCCIQKEVDMHPNCNSEVPTQPQCNPVRRWVSPRQAAFNVTLSVQESNINIPANTVVNGVLSKSGGTVLWSGRIPNYPSATYVQSTIVYLQVGDWIEFEQQPTTTCSRLVATMQLTIHEGVFVNK
eukprot:TRINITY_DN42_c0_g1_i1.p1 TRINITY_DN42_c0_g1~~TRINITY_DN42_c0_g1_i1.p1  ORF type:complete len:548 (+),score=138.28 TRINITY_DN42_c0_g1_i1:124-1767(+)